LTLQVEAKFICPEIVGPLRDGLYDVADGATIADLLDASRAECPDCPPKSWASQLMYLKNGMLAQSYTSLDEGDRIHFLRRVFGG